MKGATALPSVSTINKPINSIIKTIGPSHHFFLVFRKSQNSAMMLNLLSGSDGSDGSGMVFLIFVLNSILKIQFYFI